MMTIPVDSLTGPAKRPEKAPPYFHVMAKPKGAICNLDCKYCFFLSKEALYPGSPFRMAGDVMEAYVRQLIESQQAPQVNIAWQGGEPTLMGRGVMPMRSCSFPTPRKNWGLPKWAGMSRARAVVGKSTNIATAVEKRSR